MPAYVLLVAGLVLGLIIGSFLATLTVRWPDGRSVVAGRSTCDQCGQPLRVFELVPLLSFVLQSGKCRRCGGPIASDHIAIELAAGLIGGLSMAVAPGFIGLAGAIFGWLLLTLAVLDVKHQWLPDRLTILLATSGLLAALLLEPAQLVDRMIGGVVGYLALAAVAFAYRRTRQRDGLGGGDPKMLGGIGCWLGWQMLPLVILGASLAGIAVAISWLVRGRPVAADSVLPLGSLMAIAAFPLWIYLTASGAMLL